MKLIKIGLAVMVLALIAKYLMAGSPSRDVDVASLIESGALLIDVRSLGEFAGEHIEGAMNIPHTIIGSELKGQAKDQTIILYCHSGARAASAKHTLEKAGYTHVVNAGSIHRLQKQLGK
jgi:phage shock protein E